MKGRRDKVFFYSTGIVWRNARTNHILDVMIRIGSQVDNYLDEAGSSSDINGACFSTAATCRPGKNDMNIIFSFISSSFEWC